MGLDDRLGRDENTPVSHIASVVGDRDSGCVFDVANVALKPEIEPGINDFFVEGLESGDSFLLHQLLPNLLTLTRRLVVLLLRLKFGVFAGKVVSHKAVIRNSLSDTVQPLLEASHPTDSHQVLGPHFFLLVQRQPLHDSGD